jgi:hypothetical protein
MTDFTISCDTLVRLSTVSDPNNDDPAFRCLRIDNGCAVATNRSFMAIEHVGGPAGVIHIILDAALINQCRTEAKFDSKLTITVNEMLKFAVAKTTLGYVHPGNCVYWSDTPTDFDRWRAVTMDAGTTRPKSNGGMFWLADKVAALAASSPSGSVVFAEIIDTAFPTLIRDVTDGHWLGVFNPNSFKNSYKAATLPTWMTA